MVTVQGTANASPLTQVTEPTSPVVGAALTAGAFGTVTVGPYTNNSSVPLKIVSVALSALANLSSTSCSTPLPVTVAPGSTTNLTFTATAIAVGSYSFNIAATWSL